MGGRRPGGFAGALPTPRVALVRASALATLIAGIVLAAAAPALAQSTGISGTVSDAGTGKPIEGIEVCAFAPAEEGPVEEARGSSGCARSDSAGSYTISGLGPGSYHVAFAAPFMAAIDYVPEFYESKPSAEEATPVAVTAGAVKGGVNAQLEAGAEIAGTVTRASTGTPLSGITVCAFGPIGAPNTSELASCARSVTDGAYTVLGLPAGSYRVVFLGGESFASQVYAGKQALSAADPVSVGAKGLTTGIDAALMPPNASSGPSPAISTAPVPGSPVTAPARPGAGAVLSLAGRRIALRRGRALVRVRCAGVARCRGELILSVKRTVRVGRRELQRTVSISRFATVSIAPGGSLTAQLALNRAGRRLLRAGRGRLNANLLLLAAGAGSHAQQIASVVLIAGAAR